MYVCIYIYIYTYRNGLCNHIRLVTALLNCSRGAVVAGHVDAGHL